jgi:hypothetical protein
MGVAEYIPVREAAKQYGCDYGAIRERVKDGKLPGILHGTAYYVRLPLPPKEDLNLRKSPKAVKKLRLPDPVVEVHEVDALIPPPENGLTQAYLGSIDTYMARIVGQLDQMNYNHVTQLENIGLLLRELLDEWRNPSVRKNGVG